MIFISHTYKDKPIVEPIAQRLAEVYGMDKVFYDSWSIQPGDGIIDRMNTGLAECKFFFFFVSKNSLQSNMVKLEWQNAIIKATNAEAKIIPVKIDDCMMPTILLQTLYIDVFGRGLEDAIRQMIDVIDGRNTYSGGVQKYQNVRGKIIKHNDRKVEIEFQAVTYLEPISRYAVCFWNKKEDINYKCISDGVMQRCLAENVRLQDGTLCNTLMISVSRSTAPKFPVKILLESKTKLQIVSLMRAESDDEYVAIPYSVTEDIFATDGENQDIN